MRLRAGGLHPEAQTLRKYQSPAQHLVILVQKFFLSPVITLPVLRTACYDSGDTSCSHEARSSNKQTRESNPGPQPHSTLLTEVCICP